MNFIGKVIFIAALSVSSLAHAVQLVTWDFENPVTTGNISTFAPTTTRYYTTNASASQTGGGPAENFGGTLGIVHLTRFWGASNYPYITITPSQPVFIEDLTFTHRHNHNPGFPTFPDYDVQLQVDSGSGFVNVGGLLNLSSANNGATSTMPVNMLLEPQNYTFRWVPVNLNGGSNTGTEFFAMNDLIVNGYRAPLEPVPTVSAFGLFVLFLGFAGVAYSTFRNKQSV